MIVLTREQAKERILRTMQERVDRSRYIITPPEENCRRLDLMQELGLNQGSQRSDRS